MISYNDYNSRPEFGIGKPATIFGLSTDPKPTGDINGSVFLEMDTSKIYFWDEENETWREWA